MKIKNIFICLMVVVLFSGVAFGGGDEILSQEKVKSFDPFATPQEYSVHKEQMEELEKEEPVISEDFFEAQRLEKAGKLFQGKDSLKLHKSQQPKIDKDFIVFGYIQTEDRVYHYRWNALTHVGSLFLNFDATGNITNPSTFTGRSSYLKAGGAADAAGVKVIMVVRNQSFDEGILDTVLTSPSRRAVLISDILSIMDGDSYCQGVSLDFEFSWGTSTRDGISAFMSELRTALDASDPSYELSVYTHAIYNPSRWDIAALVPNIDYMLYSMYTWASGNTVHAISDFNSCAPQISDYFDAGLPPEKFVATISSYSKKWAGVSGYNQAASSGSSQGFTDALYDTTLQPTYSGPYADNYRTGDEVSWYTYNSGSTDYTATWDSMKALEYKIRAMLSWQDASGNWNGRKLGGVGFWSLRWMAETSSYDPRVSAPTSRTRTYPHIYQLLMPQQKNSEKFERLWEGLN